MKLLDCGVNSALKFKEIAGLLYTLAVPFYHLTSNGMEVSVSPHPYQCLIVSGFFFDYSRFSRCEMMSHCGVGLCFPGV